MTEERVCDLLVIGAGLSGMAAAARAAGHGLSCVVAGNPSSLTFSSGLMDYLGIYPAGTSCFLKVPEKHLTDLEKDFPGHAYAIAGDAPIVEGFEFIRKILAREGLNYTRVPSQGENRYVLTAMGTIKPSFMVPETMASGCRALAGDSGSLTLAVAGIKGLQGFSAAQVAEGVKSKFLDTIPVRAELPGVRTVVPPQILAGQMADPEGLNAFISQVRAGAGKADILGLPAVCGIDNSEAVIGRLQEALKIPVFEIPCSPPSIPGLRLKNAFERYLSRSGIALLSNTRIKDPVFDGTRFILTADLDPGELKIRPRGVILATGRFFGNGLHARRERIVETVFHLDIVQPLGRNLWHDSSFLSPGGHKINQAGVRTDKVFRPLDERDRPVYTHLYAVGSILAYNDWPRLKSGSGTALVSAFTAVDHFAESLADTAEAGHGC